MAKSYRAALLGALAMIGLGATQALAVEAQPDEFSVSGSTLTIKVSKLLSNNTPDGPKVFVKAYKFDLSEGIKSLVYNKKKGTIKVTLKKSFTGNTAFRYQITSPNKPRDYSVANVYLLVSPN